MTDDRLISSDSHVTIPVDAWQEYLPATLRERAPRIVQTDDGDVTEFEGRRTPINTLNNLAGKKPEEFSLNVRRLDDQRADDVGPTRSEGHLHADLLGTVLDHGVHDVGDADAADQ